MKLKLYFFTALLMSIFAVTTTKAATVVVPDKASFSKEEINKMTVEEKTARIEDIKARISEIKAMDKSNLSSAERKELRVELRDMRKEARAISSSDGMGGGVYLSVGAIIIIILLLILILH